MESRTGGLLVVHWPANELQKIATTDGLHISPFREDGVTYGTPTWIWSVVVDDALYVRGYNGRQSRWYQAAVRQKAERSRPHFSWADAAVPIDESRSRTQANLAV